MAFVSVLLFELDKASWLLKFVSTAGWSEAMWLNEAAWRAMLKGSVGLGSAARLVVWLRTRVVVEHNRVLH